MSEWPNEHAWKACEPHGSEGSNPSLSAIVLFTTLGDLDLSPLVLQGGCPRSGRGLIEMPK